MTWLRACQTSSGGFTHQPNPNLGAVEDVAYTRAAVRALKLLDSQPENPEACAQYLASLANPDGGFSNRPGWSSNPMATYDALDAITTLGVSKPASAPRPIRRTSPSLPADLQVFTIQIEAHGAGSPSKLWPWPRSCGFSSGA